MFNTTLAILGRSAAAFIVIVIGSYVIVAQNTITGEWTSKPASSDKGDIHLNLKRSSERENSSWGSTFKLSDIDGNANVQNGPVSFRIVREAGTFSLTGQAVNGRGSGNFVFTPNMSFADALRSRGIDMDSRKIRNSRSTDIRESTIEEKLMTAAITNVTLALADDLSRANFGVITLGDLTTAAIFKIDGNYLAEMKASGFPDLTFQDVVKGRIFKIDGEYVRAMNQAGMGDAGFEGLVKFKIFKVTPEFLTELRAAGLNDLSPEDIVKCKMFRIDADFIREARATDPNITIQQLINRRLGVNRVRSGR